MCPNLGNAGLASVPLIDGKSPEQRGGHKRVSWELGSNCGRQLSKPDGGRRERVVAGHSAPCLLEEDEGSRHTFTGILARLPDEVLLC
jgi:hypothetical protein